MQEVTSLYQEIFNSGNYYVETRVVICASDHVVIQRDIDNVYTRSSIQSEPFSFDESMLWSVKTKKKVFKNNYPEVGCCICGEMDMQMIMPNVGIEKASKMCIYVRLVSNEEPESGQQVKISEWIPKGVFFIDTRENTENRDDLILLSFHGYDSMMMSNKLYGDTTLEFPAKPIPLIEDIARQMGVTLEQDSYQYFTFDYDLNPPAQYTMRETLGFIGSIFGGNWVINDRGELKFIPIWNLPVETNLLVNEIGDRIVFGQQPEEEVRILV